MRSITGAIETVMFRNVSDRSVRLERVDRQGRHHCHAPPKDNPDPSGHHSPTRRWSWRARRRPALEIRPVTRDEALAADEMWLSSSTVEVLAVTSLDGKAFAGGKPGPVYIGRCTASFQASKPSVARRSPG
jgi:D-alanine transaminase